MRVIDASAVVDALLHAPGSERIRALLSAGEDLHAPHLIDLDVASVLRRFEREGELSEAEARELFEDFQRLEITRYPHRPFLERIWELRHQITADDPSYVALAEELQVPLLTRDHALASSHGHAAKIELE